MRDGPIHFTAGDSEVAQAALARLTARYGQAARETGYDDALVEPAFTAFIEARHRITLYEDVRPGLQRLRAAGYRLGSITNGNADVHRLGIGHLFDFSLTAESVGHAKPHPRLFETACRLAAVQPAQLAHVGDEAETDLAGGLAAGWAVIPTVFRRPPNPGEIVLDVTRRENFEKLPGYIPVVNSAGIPDQSAPAALMRRVHVCGRHRFLRGSGSRLAPLDGFEGSRSHEALASEGRNP